MPKRKKLHSGRLAFRRETFGLRFVILDKILIFAKNRGCVPGKESFLYIRFFAFEKIKNYDTTYSVCLLSLIHI